MLAQILGIIFGFGITIATTLLILFIIRMVKPAREIAFGKRVGAQVAGGRA